MINFIFAVHAVHPVIMYSHEATPRNPQARPTPACMVSLLSTYLYLVPSLGSLAPRPESYPTICMPGSCSWRKALELRTMKKGQRSARAQSSGTNSFAKTAAGRGSNPAFSGHRRGFRGGLKEGPHSRPKEDALGFTTRISGVPLGDIIVISGGLVLLYFYIKWKLSVRRPWQKLKVVRDP